MNTFIDEILIFELLLLQTANKGNLNLTVTLSQSITLTTAYQTNASIANRLKLANSCITADFFFSFFWF